MGLKLSPSTVTRLLEKKKAAASESKGGADAHTQQNLARATAARQRPKNSNALGTKP